MSTDNSQIAKCPKCNSSFRLSQQHLEAAKGWVQCGICGNVFHSQFITPEKPAQPAAEMPPVPAPASAAPEQSEPEQATETRTAAQPEAPEAEDNDDQPVTSMPGLSGLTNRMAEETPTTMRFGPKLESIILVDPNAPHDADLEDMGPLPVIEPRQEPGKAVGYGSSVYAASTPGTKPPPPGASASFSTAKESSRNPAPRQTAARAQSAKAAKKIPGWLWGVLSVLLLCALAIQVVWLARDSIAASSPAMRPVLSQFCEALGCELGLPRNSGMVSILGSDLQTESDGTLVLTATLANKAGTHMAWPVLDLTLTDIDDQPVARKIFAPSEYLASSKLEADGVAPMTEVPITLHLQSSGLKAAGYRLKMFY